MAIKSRRRKKFLAAAKSPKQKAVNSGLSLLQDVGVGIVGGGLAGSLIGRHSFVAGLLTSFGGYYTGNTIISTLGFGMMAANGFQTAKGQPEVPVQGLEGFDFKQELENAKQRVMNFRDSFAEKLYLDKVLKKDDLSGLGEVDYYLHGGDEDEAVAELDRLEQQLVTSAMDFQGSQKLSGYGFENEEGEIMGELDESLVEELLEVNY
jgi:hypothetical protein